jgi:hypothetical protein
MYGVQAGGASRNAITDRLWETSDVVSLIDAAEKTTKPLGPYKKRAA